MFNKVRYESYSQIVIYVIPLIICIAVSIENWLIQWSFLKNQSV